MLRIGEGTCLHSIQIEKAWQRCGEGLQKKADCTSASNTAITCLKPKSRKIGCVGFLAGMGVVVELGV